MGGDRGARYVRSHAERRDHWSKRERGEDGSDWRPSDHTDTENECRRLANRPLVERDISVAEHGMDCGVRGAAAICPNIARSAAGAAAVGDQECGHRVSPAVGLLCGEHRRMRKC